MGGSTTGVALAFGSLLSLYYYWFITSHEARLMELEEGAEEGEDALITNGPDTSACHTSIVSGPERLSRQNRPVIRFTADKPECWFEIRLDKSAWVTAKSPLRFKQALSDGRHDFQVRAVNAKKVREARPSHLMWTVDSTPPSDFKIKSMPKKLSREKDSTFVLSSGEAGTTYDFELERKSGASAPFVKVAKSTVGVRLTMEGQDTTITLSDMGGGEFKIYIFATDEAGNTTPHPLLYAWSVDLNPPDTIIHQGPPRLTKDTAATFVISGSGEFVDSYTYEFRLDGGEWQEGPLEDPVGLGYRFTLEGLLEGPRALDVRVVDRAGNVDPRPAHYKWAIHNEAADTYILARPMRLSPSPNATFTVGCSEVQFAYAYRLDEGRVVRPRGHRLVHDNDTFVLRGLEEGNHTIAIRATDVAGAEDPTPAAYSWLVDTVVPQVAVTAGPPRVSGEDFARFTVDASEPYSFQYKLDNGNWRNGHDGSTVRELEGGGLSPEVAQHLFNGPTKFKLSGLSEGRHVLALNATDVVGNVGSADLYTWVYDQGAPETAFTQTPGARDHKRVAVFSFEASEADCTFDFRLDRRVWKRVDRSHEVKYHALVDGRAVSAGIMEITVGGGFHTLELRARDAAGNYDKEGVSFEWVVG